MTQKTHVINEKQFFEALNPAIDDFRANLPLKLPRRNTSVEKVKPVTSPPAQCAELCELRTLDGVVKAAMQLIEHKDKRFPICVSAICELQFLHGLRISEVLRIKSQDIMSNGSIRVLASKGSENRIVYSLKHREFWEYMRLNSLCLPSYINRFYIRRVYITKGIYAYISGKKQQSVTHALRYNFIRELLANNVNIEDIQKQIGHKQLNSTIHYVENLKT